MGWIVTCPQCGRMIEVENLLRITRNDCERCKMDVNESEVTEVLDTIDYIETSVPPSRLTAWERRFLEDLRVTLADGSGVSELQKEKLEEIKHEKGI